MRQLEITTYNGNHWVAKKFENHRTIDLARQGNGGAFLTYHQPQLGGITHADAPAKIDEDKMLPSGYL